MSFSVKTTHKAKQIHLCDWCRQVIPIGETYVKYRGFMEHTRGFMTDKRHKHCTPEMISNPEIAQKICDEWNEKVPVGTEVEYEEVIGNTGPFNATTRSEAWVVCGSAMVMITGKSGGVAIDHMTGWHGITMQKKKSIC